MSKGKAAYVRAHSLVRSPGDGCSREKNGGNGRAPTLKASGV